MVPDSKQKEEDSVKVFSQHGPWTSDTISDGLDLSLWHWTNEWEKSELCMCGLGLPTGMGNMRKLQPEGGHGMGSEEQQCGRFCPSPK